jgi:hypothetical protein
MPILGFGVAQGMVVLDAFMPAISSSRDTRLVPGAGGVGADRRHAIVG